MAKIYNYSWGSGIGADGKPIYAPADFINLDGRTIFRPKDIHYQLAGFYSVIDEPPTNPAPSGYHWAAAGWEMVDSKILRVYEAVENPRVVCKFSKLKLYSALVSAGLWEAFEGWLKSQDIGGVNGYTAFSLAQDLSDDHPLFNSLYAAAKAALGVSDEEAERILEAAREV